MPILLVFVLVGSCIDRIDWPAPPGGMSPERVAALTAAAVLLPIAAAVVLSRAARRGLRRDSHARAEIVRRYLRIRRALQFANLGLVLAAVVWLGWGWTIHHTLMIERDGVAELAPFAELLVPLPYFVLLLGSWLAHYDVERELAPRSKPFWSRGGYVLHQSRQLLLLVGLPLGLFVSQQTFVRTAPEWSASDAYRFGSLAAVPLLVLAMPLVVRPLLGLTPLPAGPQRSRLESLAQRLGFRAADLLVWPTRSSTANAMIVGLLPRVRYVIFTDRLLDELPPEELDAVFGHEVGHAKHGHIWYYAGFLALSMAAIAAGFLLVDRQLAAAGIEVPAESADWFALPPLAVSGAYIFLVFGFLSRRCERQADVFGCRAVSCVDPHCTGHDETTAYPPRGRGLCPTGIRTFARGLERVCVLNGHDAIEHPPRPRSLSHRLGGILSWLRDWMHSTIPHRIEFLATLIRDPARERRFQRRVFWLRWGLMTVLAATLFGLGSAVGWRELLRAL